MNIQKIIPELIVNNMESMINFYTSTFDFTLEMTDPETKPYTWVQIRNGNNLIMMQRVEETKKEIPSLKDKIIGTDLIMIKVDSPNEVKRINKLISEKEIQVCMAMRETEYGSCELAVHDPEGRVIIISG